MNLPNVGRILDFWEAYDRVNALPDPWTQTATICTEINLLRATLAAANGMESSPTKQENYMPPRWVPPPMPKRTKVMSDDELSAALDKRLA